MTAVPSNTAGKPIKCRAAIAWAPKQPLTIEEIEVAPPKAGEVRIKICYTALCHSDTLDWCGRDIDGAAKVVYPAILGHEAAGIVESVGESVTQLKPGDHVLPCFLHECGQCKNCKSPNNNACLQFLGQPAGVLFDDTSRFTLNGKMIHHFLTTSTFSEYTVCPASSCTKIPADAPMETVCLLSCGAGTGYGAATKACKVERGSRCAVWGIGGVGLSVVMGCKAAGASQIVAVDVCPSKFDIAKRLGATDYVNPLTIPKDKTLSQYLTQNFDGGFDYTFECIGKEETAMDALASAQVGSGVTCLIGVPSKGVELKVSPMEFIVGKTLKGCLFGGHKPHEDLPKLVEAHMSGKMPLEEIVSHRMKLEDINQAFDLLYKGECIRTVMEVGSK